MDILRAIPSQSVLDAVKEGAARQEPAKDHKIPAFKPDGFDFRSISTAPTPMEEKLGKKIVDFFKKAGSKIKEWLPPSPIEVLAKNLDPFRNR